MTERIVLVVSLALIFGGGVVAINASYASTGEQTTITGEGWTPDTGNVTTLNNSNLETAIYDPAVKVYDENGTRVMAAEDYTWYRSNGTIKALSGGELANDASATITYEYSEPDSSARTVAGLLGRGMNVASFFVFVVGIGIVLAAVRFFGGI